ncbi:response regulator [Extibacter muris]|uniref:response regulator n=2 Tax=Lachnospiraceae TaxID=186803 RepID=UPI001D0670D1|nr:response regulator [Extibacter muris]MCB6203554.1 response regulator [Extibacter muris]MCQ4665065.1 response regulator [Extibacter muris]MCQ4694431.1 response regulator [Extibacter muris]
MERKGNGSTKKKVALAAACVGAILCVLTFFFIQAVKQQLWEQSVETIMESTRQGCTTLKVQLQDDIMSIRSLAEHIEGYSLEHAEEIIYVVQNFSKIEEGVSLYLENGNAVGPDMARDSGAVSVLLESDAEEGIINPHISSVTGMNVFDVFVKVTLKDGTEGYVLKEYEVESIVDSFSLSFYNDAGFSYVVDAGGDVLIRSPHHNSNKTIKNLFDILKASDNDTGSVREFAQSLEDARTGWAVFDYKGETTVFCYTPLELESDWFLVSIIPEGVVSAQTNDIIFRSMVLIASIIIGILILAVLYLRYANRTNRKLRNQAEYISHLYNAIPEGIALISAQPPYRLIQLNEEGMSLLAYPAGEPDNKLEDIRLEEMFNQEEGGAIHQLFADTAVSDGKHTFENRMKKADGSYMWAAGIVERTLDEDGHPVLIAAFHDITAEKQKEVEAEREQLQERVTLVGAISNAYPVIISVNLTRDLVSFIYVKSGLLLHLGEENTYSELFSNMEATVHPDNREEYRRRFAPERIEKTLGRKKKEVFLEMKQKLMDGNYHWTSTQIIYVDNPYSDDKLAILISRRTDEQRHEEEQRRQALQTALDNARGASEAKSRFLSNMSHDIRTPMNAIVGMTAVAEAHLGETERVRECLDKINRSGSHLLSLINDVLDMSRIESGKLSLGDEPFNLAESVMEMVELVRPQAEAKQIRIDVQLYGLEDENVVGDALRIRQIGVNILSNAVKYTPAGGSVEVKISQAKSSRKSYHNFIFRCADTGIGMSEEFLDKLFLPFERAKDSTSSKVVGTGLGMAITKNVIDLMNGDIQVESEPGKGSVFTVTVPLRIQEDQHKGGPREWNGARCLIIDDEKCSCRNVTRILGDLGLDVQYRGADDMIRICRNPEELAADNLRLVIFGWEVPSEERAEAVRKTREMAGQDIPILALRTQHSEEVEDEAIEAGVSLFLFRPCYRSQMSELLERLDGGGEQAKEEEQLGSTPDLSGKHLLLVEDNEMNREIARELIGELGVQIDEACDGKEAVMKVAESADGYYDLILMDIQMPEMDGYEATRNIRLLERNDVRGMPVIAMTANAFDEDVRMALRAGMNAHFSKPIDVRTLRQMLYTYLSQEGQSQGET